MKVTTIFNTPLGSAEISGNEDGITSIQILNKAQPESNDIPEILIPAVGQLTAYFNGDLKTFSLKLNPEGTPFQKKVWDALTQIPFGTTMSYLELSQKLGDVKAIRAVAAANGKNPLWIVVPCHRVIGSDGSLTGYAGGLWRKKWLLEHEHPPAQQSLF
ncbi:MAG TPA: methylated-DNA--[protein]-cysteine S-methyltransferase [Gillisia sp.]|nr:methylated-DNA--[protein]-cysteine S-methyltransferase [Gillisia sp.]